MDNERLQDIKAKHLLHGAEEWTNQEDADTEAVIKELIAAVEVLQAELVEAEAEQLRESLCGKWRKEIKVDKEMQEEIADLRQKNTGLHIDISNLRKQLAEARANCIAEKAQLISKMQKRTEEGWAKLAEAQAENERLRGELKIIQDNSKRWAEIIEQPYG